MHSNTGPLSKSFFSMFGLCLDYLFGQVFHMTHVTGADRASSIDGLGQLRVATQHRLSSLPEGDVRPNLDVISVRPQLVPGVWETQINHVGTRGISSVPKPLVGPPRSILRIYTYTQHIIEKTAYFIIS